MQMQIKIPCLHETGEVKNTNVTVSDHYLLNKTEITKLLIYAAKNLRNPAIVSGVQVRLTQGIKGMTCPRPIKGTVAKKMSKLDALFMERYTEGGIPEIVDKLYKIMAS